MSNDWDNSWDTGAQWNTPQAGQQQQQQHNTGYGGGADYYQQQQQQHQQQQPSQQYGNPYGGDSFVQPQQPGNGFGGFAGQQFMADPMLKAAQQFGGQFAEQQKEKLSKYISGFNLKYYFAVDNLYVGKKLGILLFPFFHSEWSPKFTGNDEPVPARDDINAPDLYIPLMAFLTYVLVSGFVLGTQGRFSPEMLGILTSNAFIWVIIENIVIFVSKYVMNISQSMSVWHSLAFSTYKFVGMILCLVMFMAGGKTFYYGALAYTAAALSCLLAPLLLLARVAATASRPRPATTMYKAGHAASTNYAHVWRTPEEKLLLTSVRKDEPLFKSDIPMSLLSRKKRREANSPSTPSSPLAEQQIEFLHNSWRAFRETPSGELDTQIVTYSAEKKDTTDAEFEPFNIDKFLAEKLLSELGIDPKLALF